ncbi:glycosaminoglycan xylosylkinase-like isoform X2 [Antedon mediterranea]|uniref:glycosaminoglycan xylosylkinase-like isoform X2 n=1 Tax=Antedon mediterranea TaxID=105859 RepID=UPI003AF6A2CF
MRLKKKKLVLWTVTLIIAWFLVIVVIFPSSNMNSSSNTSQKNTIWNILKLVASKRTLNIGKSNSASKGSRIIPEAEGVYKRRVDEIFLNANSKERKQTKSFSPELNSHNDSIQSQPKVFKQPMRTEKKKYILEDDLSMKKLVGNSDFKKIWDIATKWVSGRHIIPENAPELGDVLHAMATRPITKADVGYKGTQLKVTLYLAGGQVVVFKPKRFSRDHVIEGSPVAGYDRHNGEIAAFHLDRILGFRFAPLVVGRIVNLTKEIIPVATDELMKTFIYRDGNQCFYGKCFYCTPLEPACAEGEIMEGSVTLWLPKKMALRRWRHPWSRTYKEGVQARWEYDDTYCEDVKRNYPVNRFPLILDMTDAAVFDSLIGNADRHMYETFKEHGDTARMLHLDNAKRLRKSTWIKLQELKNGQLSQVMEAVLSHDPISPVLSDLHLQAMDRRLQSILEVVGDCFQKEGMDNVLVATPK